MGDGASTVQTGIDKVFVVSANILKRIVTFHAPEDDAPNIAARLVTCPVPKDGAPNIPAGVVTSPAPKKWRTQNSSISVTFPVPKDGWYTQYKEKMKIKQNIQ